MKTFILLCLVAVALCQDDKNAKIVNYQSGIAEDGGFDLAFETTNGISAQEEGTSYPGAVAEAGNYVRSGSYSYEWEGVTYTVEWTADENGFHPQGDHLPDFSHAQEHIGAIE